MKKMHFSKLLFPILGMSGLLITGTIVATSCSNEEVPSDVAANQKLSRNIYLMFEGFKNNEQALLSSDTQWKTSLNDFVSKFNENNSQSLKDANNQSNLKLYASITGNTKIEVFYGTSNNFANKTQLKINNKSVFSYFSVEFQQSPDESGNKTIKFIPDSAKQAD